MKKNKLSFKKAKVEKGLAGVAHPIPGTRIKMDGEIIGWISPRNYAQKFFKIHFHVACENSFKNITLKKECDTEEEAREFIENNWENLQAKYQFYKVNYND